MSRRDRNKRTLKEKILRNPNAKEKLFRAMGGEKDLSFTLDDRRYSVEKIRVFERPADESSEY